MQMQKAAVLAKLISDTTSGHAHLSFVTEGEASLHFALQNGFPIGMMKNGDRVVIVDAGGGTIDISSYSKNIRGAKAFEEVAKPQCKIYLIIYDFLCFKQYPRGHFHGSVFVTAHAQLFFGGCVLHYIHQVLIILSAA